MNLFWKGFHYGLLPTNEKPSDSSPSGRQDDPTIGCHRVAEPVEAPCPPPKTTKGESRLKPASRDYEPIYHPLI